MTTGQRAAVIGILVGKVWIALIVVFIALDQPPPPGASDAESLRAGVEHAVRSGDEADLQADLPAGEIGVNYAAGLLERFPDDRSVLRARLDHADDVSVITVSSAGSPGSCVQWAVVVIEENYLLDPVPLTTACRP
jgi:hypothetical protein